MKFKLLTIVLLLASLSANLIAQGNQTQRRLAQPVLMALPQSTPTKDPVSLFNEDKNVQAAYTAINKVMADRKLEIKDLKQALANIDKMRAKYPSFANDPNAFISANAGADVYLEYSIEIIKEGPATKARINVNVKESATAKILGANSGTSKAMVTNDISSLTEIALNNCIESIMQQIRGYWTDMPTNGKPILVLITSDGLALDKPTSTGKRINRELTNLMKNNTISYNANVNTSLNIEYNPVYIDIYKYDDITEFQYLIEDLMESLGVVASGEIAGKSITIIVSE